ncbi:NAD(P)-dependent dehydrogenase (short-subunit alcohol dehydrogenase family) [Methylohalomonas lacus]|uniref:NAD(P)-dependent dehydrogenase (Short-subunit alcohol dehydrogenase family) n=1 Tax=Methylohalomonas lacus TaxID=398773 RepID=A0AAE3L3P1_9GAMM|nr:SDR family oxidoreductase [Methylohalomonas lacus]MCS3902468.1 NAD(P)-dependent dehydrogenase (short-subunit alcohol dehydrogenase family) [Methylohalomonas lacus]
MEIRNKVAIVTGAASGIGQAVAGELAQQGVKAIAIVDMDDAVEDTANDINQVCNRDVAVPFKGDVTDATFRAEVFGKMRQDHGVVSICVPAAGITRDSLAVKVDKESGKSKIYDVEKFRQVTEVNLVAPIYWALEMIAGIAEDRAAHGKRKWHPDETVQGTVIFIGSISSQGNKGQVAYATTKAGLEGAAATLTMEAIFHGVRCGVIHPGFTDTPMVRALGDEFIEKHILPHTQLNRLIRPEEIANAICFMIANSAISGEIWADAGWHPQA